MAKTRIADGCGKLFDPSVPETRGEPELRPFWMRYCPEHRMATGQTFPAIAEVVEVFLGYRVEKLDEKEEICCAYKIIGPRKVFYLMRNQGNRNMLFVIPEGCRARKIRGYEWFTDQSGTLKPCR